MSLQTSFLIYATLFRLAIIAAGTASIFLGYRLFRAGFLTEGKAGGTTVEAHFVGQKFLLKNAAPGTAFALFGVIIVGVMVAQGNPELTVKSLASVPEGSSRGESEVMLRGEGPAPPSKFEEAVARGLEYDKQKDHVNAVSAYEDALKGLATPLNQLAWNYYQLGNVQEAVPLARLAVQFCPRQAAYADTLSEVLAKQGQTDEALQWMTKAVVLDARYAARLAEMKRTAGR
jgi:tetratricopeptide (TPR) repeat protein